MIKNYNKLLLTLAFSLFIYSTNAQNHASDIVFQIKVEANAQNSSIKLSWNKLPNVTGYKVYRKLKGAANFSFVTDRLYNDTFFVDNNVPMGTAYEYSINASHTNQITGYVCAGLDMPVKHHQGNVLLVIDSTYIVPAHNEIELFKRDLIKDGWKVLVQYAGRGETPQAVKQRISSCNSSALLEGVILMGHIPVAYSGNIAPDAHSDHQGAWPADVYYGDMCTSANNLWHDLVLVNTSASSVRNHNVVGDGKYDISSVGNSTSHKIFVGRIDVVNMSYISSDDVQLFKQYINKNHAYKASIKKFKKQGLIDDNFGYYYGEAFAQNGWRNMSALLGPENVSEGDYMTDLKSDSYLWSYACGGGWNTGCSGVGNTIAFGSNEIESVFTMLYGSYFGDWDVSNNFLRAPIASPSSTLVSFWAGRPNWFMHTMALGDPIGYSYLNTVDNVGAYFPKGYANSQVHQSLQGDPTLKMYMYEAPTNLEAFEINNGTSVKLEWLPSVDSTVVGYYIYRATSLDGDFVLLNQTPNTSLEFIDTNPIPSNSNLSSTAYMVKAVKLEQTATGSFYNLSPGEIAEGYSTNAPLPVTVTEFSGQAFDDANSLFWEVEKEDNIDYYEIERSENASDYSAIGQHMAMADEGGHFNYEFIDNTPQQDNYYRLKIVDINGSFVYHKKIVRLKKATNVVLEASLFPNPATNNIKIKVPNSIVDEDVHVTIFDLQGRTVLMKSTNMQSQDELDINIEKLIPGQYILRFIKEESRGVVNLKFIKMD